MPFSPQELAHYAALDQKLVEAARHIKVLSALGWPATVYEEFMAGWRSGNPKLPVVELPQVNLQDRRRALAQVILQADPGHPLGRYIIQTAASYVIAARMLESVGKREFRQFSEMLYGTPHDKLGRLSNLALADDFIKITADFAAAVEGADAESQQCILPETVAAELKTRADAFFVNHKVSVVIDKDLASKAAAGAERVRIRGMTSFSRAEIDQLLEHEVFVHSATMLNGRAQPHFKSLGLGSPRTTCAQEGLATFAELITTTMDLSRLRRIALRIKAIEVGLSGGSFIDVFRFFLDAGQSEKESFQSTARIFRGGDVRGSHVFTKDVVYLKGLFSVHTFLSKAIEMRKLDYPQFLFIGRLTLGDVINLEPFIQQGVISKAPYLPRWVANREGLAAYLSYSVFTRHLNLADIKLADFI
ncbi:MAG: DUF1704 domain-containing protein, partial [Proteobacteria bacterium]|nr:DUF1704 domain-containing protein [Pseudomonadota bacterium]